MFAFPIIIACCQMLLLWAFRDSFKKEIQEQIPANSINNYSCNLHESDEVLADRTMTSGTDISDLSISRYFSMQRNMILHSKSRDTDNRITYTQLLQSDYKRNMIIGVALVWIKHLSGVYEMHAYSYYFGFKNERYGGLRLINAFILVWFSFIAIFLINIVKRKSLLMKGYLIMCLWNGIIFQIHDEK